MEQFANETMLCMTDYSGSATLVLTSGAEQLVTVNLQAKYTGPGSMPEWGGTVEADRDDLLLAEQSSFSLTLRLPDDRRGEVMVTHVDDEIDEEGVTWATIIGVGHAPFGRP